MPLFYPVSFITTIRHYLMIKVVEVSEKLLQSDPNEPNESRCIPVNESTVYLNQPPVFVSEPKRCH